MTDFATHVTFCRAGVKLLANVSPAILTRNARSTHVLVVCRMLLNSVLRILISQASIMCLRLLVPTVHLSLRTNMIRVQVWAWTHTYGRRRRIPVTGRINLGIGIPLQNLTRAASRLRMLGSGRGTHAMTGRLIRCATDAGCPRMQVR